MINLGRYQSHVIGKEALIFEKGYHEIISEMMESSQKSLVPNPLVRLVEY